MEEKERAVGRGRGISEGKEKLRTSRKEKEGGKDR